MKKRFQPSEQGDLIDIYDFWTLARPETGYTRDADVVVTA
jgi:hypothetical protein